MMSKAEKSAMAATISATQSKLGLLRNELFRNEVYDQKRLEMTLNTVESKTNDALEMFGINVKKDPYNPKAIMSEEKGGSSD